MSNSRSFNMYLDYLYQKSEYSSRMSRNSNGDNDVVDADLNAIEVEVNNEITFFDSGGGAAIASVGAGGTAVLAPAAVPGTLAATGFAQAIPIVGQVVAVVAAVVAVGQVFHNIDKTAQYKRIIAKVSAVLAEKNKVIAADQVEHQNQIAILDREILYRETQLSRTQTMNTIVLVTLAVSGLVFVYSITKLAKK